MQKKRYKVIKARLKGTQSKEVLEMFHTEVAYDLGHPGPSNEVNSEKLEILQDDIEEMLEHFKEGVRP